MYKTHQHRTTFGSCDVEKVRAVVTPKCTKHTRFGPLLEVDMTKKCRPLWREAHFQIKMYHTHHVRSTLESCDVEEVYAIVARSTFRGQNAKKHYMFGPLLDVQMSFRVAGTIQETSCALNFPFLKQVSQSCL